MSGGFAAMKDADDAGETVVDELPTVTTISPEAQKSMWDEF